ncbi:Ribonuclease H [bioreactor metagenome]|uniref:ribonuclease H n=1 Tax=bioreactor metagenome TaxID=1076179 RepID=A0A644Y3V1_9ZZZZ|nr:ribonuclease HI [Christensenella sp.]
MKKQVTIYTDGACSGNPGPGGWGAILMYQNQTKELSGFEPETTNNRMELMAVIEAARALKQPCEIAVHSDSAYVCNAFHQNWLNNWQANGWKTASKRDVENQDLWRILLDVLRQHTVSFVKVKGHSDNPYNNRCDELARLAIRQALDSQSL